MEHIVTGEIRYSGGGICIDAETTLILKKNIPDFYGIK